MQWRVGQKPSAPGAKTIPGQPIRQAAFCDVGAAGGTAIDRLRSKIVAKEVSMSTPRTRHKWSAQVTEHSDAMDLEERIFESHDPKHIAASLKRSAEHSERRKAEPFQSAMSMLNFYINRAGKNLPAKQKQVLEKAKNELRHAFGRPETD
jgi:hypothetical protein